MKLAVLSFLFSFLSFLAVGQNEMTAYRINSAIKIDGKLDDVAWMEAEPSSNFTQYEPYVDTEPSFKSEVRVVYDNQGLYVGAHLYQDASTLLKELSPRDSRSNTDWFSFTIDPYGSGVNGFAFIVTASGVQQDQRLSLDGRDSNWDAIWQSEVSLVDDGWIVEMKIPYSAIRFPDKDQQEWKVQFGREIRYKREQVFWNRRDPQIETFINQCGELRGVENVKTPVRLSLTPFVVGYIDHDGGDAGTSTAYSAGMDLKYGINDAFTLDMTLIPDFGQVISDNVVVNLGPFEQFFEENRQFFTEGIELFNKGNLFYTRRIGGRPFNYFNAFDQLGENEEVVSNPITSPLINATKVTGRTTGGTGIGVFNAVVNEEFATIQNTETGEKRSYKTNPLTNYNVIVLDQNLANNSTVSLVNTSAIRFGEEYDANVTGGFFDFKNKPQNYGVSGQAIVSQKYFEDQTDIGHSYRVFGGKIGGRWRATLQYSVESENYDHNDVGFLFSPNERSARLRFSYNEFKPKNKNIVRWNINLSPRYERLYKPNVFTQFSINGGGFLVTKNRLGTGFNFSVNPVGEDDYFEPRTSDFSQFYKLPASWSFGGFVSTDYRKTFALDLRTDFTNFSEEGRLALWVEVEPRIRFNNKLSLIATTSYNALPNEIGYLSTSYLDVDVPGLNDGILFGRRDRDILVNSLRVNYIFTNKMALSVRLRHYWDRFIYNRYSRLEPQGDLSHLSFDGLDSGGNRYYDSNFNIFNIDLFYTWRFAPGSDIIFAYKNAVSKSDDQYDRDYFGNITNLFDANQFNSFSLRVVYFLDYQSIVPQS